MRRTVGGLDSRLAVVNDAPDDDRDEQEADAQTDAEADLQVAVIRRHERQQSERRVALIAHVSVFEFPPQEVKSVTSLPLESSWNEHVETCRLCVGSML